MTWGIFGVIASWTLDWDEETKTLSKMRSKETEADYRYFKEPDLLAVKLTAEKIKEFKDSLPELPLERQNRLIKEYNLPISDAEILTSDLAISNYFIDAVTTYDSDAISTSNWIKNDVLGLMNDMEKSVEELYLSPEYLSEIILLVDNGTINTSTGKALIRKTEEQKKEPSIIVEEEGLAQLTDTSAIEAICREVVEANPDQVEQYQSGKKGVIGWFMGQVMSQSGGKADPQAVREILIKLLEG